MKNESIWNSLVLNTYTFNDVDKIFILKSIDDLYSVTADKIKIIRTLRDNEIKFQEQENGDIKIICLV